MSAAHRTIVRAALLTVLGHGTILADSPLLDGSFDLPEGFHIYRAAAAEQTGGSFDLTFDSRGRLLVGDGRAVRRLHDENNDGIYDRHEVVADGPAVGGRGPQGLLVIDDDVYVVAGDGVQLFRGANGNGRLTHVRRLGQPFNTGGDHAAHTVLRGLDGYVYLVTGDGGGTGGRRHITEESSPALEERAASVFRFDPSGGRWECIGSGGRNPPSLGMNYLGEFFSFDSDMEFHVDVPFYRPVRLNHWTTGGDHGWQSVGAFPPYYVDCLPGILDVGRGSPNWGIVYEHEQLPMPYRDTFLVCDYRWKSATSGQYATSGRLLAFHLQRKGAGWTSRLSEMAKAKPNAKDSNGRPINFALVDIDVAPDGSLFVSDHNQGIWRIFFDKDPSPSIPPIQATHENDGLETLLSLPQPASAWSLRRERELRRTVNDDALRDYATDQSRTLRQRLRAIRLVAREFQKLDRDWIVQLAGDRHEEVRGQAAWLVGIRGRDDELEIVGGLLNDRSPFVRRRAAEALTRNSSTKTTAPVVAKLGDPSRIVRYAAMIAASHRSTSELLAASASMTDPNIRMRVLVAAHLRKERPEPKLVRAIVADLIDSGVANDAERLDLLRVLALYRNELSENAAIRKKVVRRIIDGYPAKNRNVRWEQARLLGQYGVASAFPMLVTELVTESDHVTQFHLAMALSELSKPKSGWDVARREELADWLITTQTGWFAEFGGKGLQFPSFWATTLNKLVGHHADVLATRIDDLKPGSQLATTVFDKVETIPDADAVLIGFYKRTPSAVARRSVVELLGRVRSEKAAHFLAQQFRMEKDAVLRTTLLQALSRNAAQLPDSDLFLNSLFEFDDRSAIAASIDGLVATNATLESVKKADRLALADLKGHQAVHFRLIELMERQPELIRQIEIALRTLTGHVPPGLFSRPRCIWSSTAQRNGDVVWFAKEFEVPKEPSEATLIITCDNEYVAFVNGTKVSAGTDWVRPQRVSLDGVLRSGKNLIAIEGKNLGGPAGLVCSLSWKGADGVRRGLATDTTWKLSTKPPADWQTHGASRGAWRQSLDVSEPTKNALDAFHSFIQRDNRDDRLAIQEYWHKWYLERHRSAFVARPSNELRRPDEDVHRVITSLQSFAGNAAGGRALYLKAGCYACHGGIDNQKTTIFGPALGGVTLRLKRNELADAIVYPSKHVVERFKASVLETVEGRVLKGFITEDTDQFVSITDLQNRVTRLAKDDVESITAQPKSLMPDRLLSGFTDEQIRDLLAFLASLK